MTFPRPAPPITEPATAVKNRAVNEDSQSFTVTGEGPQLNL